MLTAMVLRLVVLCLSLAVPFVNGPVAHASSIGGGIGGTTSIVASAVTYYVCAKGAGGTCVYNGDVGTLATPSDANNCTGKATPCATIAGVASKINGKILAAVVTVQLADTAGTGTDCYRPNNTIFTTSSVSRESTSAMELGFGFAGSYPTSYLYILGNTTTPANVKVTGATTCAGTTSTDSHGLVFSNVVIRVRGIQLQYFNNGTNIAGGGIIGISAMIYGEDNHCIGDGVATQSFAYLAVKGEVSLGNSIQSTFTKCQVLDVFNEAQATTISPLGRANLNIDVTGWTFGAGIFLVNELSHMGIDGASITVNGGATGVGTVYYILASGTLTWNDNSTFTAPTQTHSYNGSGLTLIASQQGSYAFDACRTIGSLVCNIGNVTPLAYRAKAYEHAYIRYLTRGTVTNQDTVADNSSVWSPSYHWQAVGSATTFANLGAPANGVETYCSDCTFANPCAGSGTGAKAKRLNGAWRCD